MCLTGFHYIFYKKIIKKELPKIKEIYDMRVMFLAGIFILVVMIIMVLLYKNIFIRYTVVLAILVYAIIKRDKIKDILINLK